MSSTSADWQSAVAEVDQARKSGTAISLKGKSYMMVVDRLAIFRKHFPNYGIETELLFADEKYVRTKTTITNEDSRVIGCGVAEENRTQGPVNKTAALMNCETSSLGRALASIGLIGSDSYASAEEMVMVDKRKEPTKSEAVETIEDIEDIPIAAVDWPDFIAKGIQSIEKQTDLKSLKDWSNVEGDNLRLLKHYSKQNYNDLLKVYKAKQTELGK